MLLLSRPASALCNLTEEWEIPREKVTLTKELGHGSFGIVYEGVVCEAASARQNYHVPTAAAIKVKFCCNNNSKIMSIVAKFKNL
jgi:insulin-like growth factor 1 receptor